MDPLPRWVDSILQWLLGREKAETISGDLLEEYREAVQPSYSLWRGRLWFVRQLFAFAWRLMWLWIALLAALGIGRDAVDWFIPTHDFRLRSIITTYAVIGLFVALGCRQAWRTRSMRGSVFAAFFVSAIGGLLKMAGVALMYGIWHDESVRHAIAASGGLEESFSLPSLLFLPAVVLALTGGILGKTAAMVFRKTHA